MAQAFISVAKNIYLISAAHVLINNKTDKFISNEINLISYFGAYNKRSQTKLHVKLDELNTKNYKFIAEFDVIIIRIGVVKEDTEDKADFFLVDGVEPEIIGQIIGPTLNEVRFF